MSDVRLITYCDRVIAAAPTPPQGDTLGANQHRRWVTEIARRISEVKPSSSHTPAVLLDCRHGIITPTRRSASCSDQLTHCLTSSFDERTRDGRLRSRPCPDLDRMS
jgi:hypothetical protein